MDLTPISCNRATQAVRRASTIAPLNRLATMANFARLGTGLRVLDGGDELIGKTVRRGGGKGKRICLLDPAQIVISLNDMTLSVPVPDNLDKSELDDLNQAVR